MNIAIAILLLSVFGSFGYCAFLQQIHDIYSPDFIWVTVVVGNIFVGCTFALFATLDFFPWAAVAWLIAVNVAWGLPIIIWQIGQAKKRHKERGL